MVVMEDHLEVVLEGQLHLEKELAEVDVETRHDPDHAGQVDNIRQQEDQVVAMAEMMVTMAEGETTVEMTEEMKVTQLVMTG